MKSYTHLAFLFLMMLSIGCKEATTKPESDLKSLFEMEVKNVSKGMLKVKAVTQLTKAGDISASDNEKMIDIDYEVTLELTEDAWRLVDANNKGSSHYQLYKNKPKPLDYYGKGTTL